MCIVITYRLVSDVINLKINLSILIKPFSYMIKKSGQKKYLKNEKAFNIKQETFFIIFKGLSVVRNSLTSESGLLKLLFIVFERVCGTELQLCIHLYCVVAIVLQLCIASSCIDVRENLAKLSSQLFSGKYLQ